MFYPSFLVNPLILGSSCIIPLSIPRDFTRVTPPSAFIVTTHVFKKVFYSHHFTWFVRFLPKDESQLSVRGCKACGSLFPVLSEQVLCTIFMSKAFLLRDFSVKFIRYHLFYEVNQYDLLFRWVVLWTINTRAKYTPFCLFYKPLILA